MNISEIAPTALKTLKPTDFCTLVDGRRSKAVALEKYVKVLLGSYTQTGVRQWFHRKRPQLDNKTPFVVLNQADAWSEGQAAIVDELIHSLAADGA